MFLASFTEACHLYRTRSLAFIAEPLDFHQDTFHGIYELVDEFFTHNVSRITGVYTST
jgi:hypothetical protein